MQTNEPNLRDFEPPAVPAGGHPKRSSWPAVAFASVLVCAILAAAAFVGVSLTSDDSDSATAAVPVDRLTHTTAIDGESVEQGQRDDVDTSGQPDGGPVSSTSHVVNDDVFGRIDVSNGITGGAGEATGDITIALPGGGDLTLQDSKLDVEVDADGNVTGVSSGVTTLELPTVGALAGAFMDADLPANVGMARGDELAHLKAHLIDDHDYLYFDLGAQPFELFLDLDDEFAGADSLPQRVSTTGESGSTMFVMDLDGDYFYLSTPCSAMVPQGSAKQRPTSKRAVERTEEAPIPGVFADVSGFDPGGCGVGWSVGGQIPFRPMMTDRVTDIPDTFTANLVIDGTVPVHKAASLDGELFFRFDPDRSTVWANAELDLGLTFLKGAAEVKVPAARGTVGLSIGSTNFDLWATATTGTHLVDGSPVEMLADLAPISGQLDLDGELHFLNDEIQATSFLQLAGDMTISNGNVVTAAAGVETDNMLAAEGVARIDASGVQIRGHVAVSPLSLIDVQGTASLDFKIPFEDPADSHFEIVGSLAIGDTVLGGEASLRLDRSGAHARGELQLAGMAALAVEGKLGPAGFQLTGVAEAVLPIGDLDMVAANLVDEASNAEQIRVLNAQVDQRVNELAAANPSKEVELRNTVRDFRQAFAEVAVANENIRINNAKIADVQRRIQADIDWHWALNDFDRFWDKGPHGIRLAALYAEQGVFETANVANYAYRDTANAILSTAQQVALGVVGWDGELNGLVTLQAEAYWGTLTGNVVGTILNGADLILDAFGIDGSAVGTATFTVGTDGVGASVDLQWCRDGDCSQIVDATVSLAPTVQLCGTILGINACAPLP